MTVMLFGLRFLKCYVQMKGIFMTVTMKQTGCFYRQKTQVSEDTACKILDTLCNCGGNRQRAMVTEDNMVAELSQQPSTCVRKQKKKNYLLSQLLLVIMIAQMNYYM